MDANEKYPSLGDLSYEHANGKTVEGETENAVMSSLVKFVGLRCKVSLAINVYHRLCLLICDPQLIILTSLYHVG